MSSHESVLLVSKQHFFATATARMRDTHEGFRAGERESELIARSRFAKRIEAQKDDKWRH